MSGTVAGSDDLGPSGKIAPRDPSLITHLVRDGADRVLGLVGEDQIGAERVDQRPEALDTEDLDVLRGSKVQGDARRNGRAANAACACAVRNRQ